MTEAIRRQYEELKAKYPDRVLLFRSGNIYEAFGDDAKIVSKVCNINLSESEGGKSYVAFPHYSIDTYLPKLIRAGHTLALCDQLEAPKPVKRIIKRSDGG